MTGRPAPSSKTGWSTPLEFLELADKGPVSLGKVNLPAGKWVIFGF